jgi:hypothetical protein
LIANFEAFLLLFLIIKQVLFSLAEFVLMLGSKHRFLLLIIIKVKIVKTIVVHWLLSHFLGSTQRGQILEQAEGLLAAGFLFLFFRVRVLFGVLFVVFF